MRFRQNNEKYMQPIMSSCNYEIFKKFKLRNIKVEIVEKAPVIF